MIMPPYGLVLAHQVGAPAVAYAWGLFVIQNLPKGLKCYDSLRSAEKRLSIKPFCLTVCFSYQLLRNVYSDGARGANGTTSPFHDLDDMRNNLTSRHGNCFPSYK